MTFQRYGIRIGMAVELIFLSRDDLGLKIQLCPNSGESALRGKNSKICLFLNQLIENQQLYTMSKTQSPMLIRRGEMKGFLLFDFENRFL